jgi:hypothetical protein
MIPKSGDRFSDKIMFKKKRTHDPEKWDRFPACAKPRHRFVVSLDASAGEGRSDKIMVKQKARAG